MLISVFDAAVCAAKAEGEQFKEIPRAAIRAGGSALGARPKFWAAIGSDKATVLLGDVSNTPAGFTPCLLKFAPSRGDKNEPFFEVACLELANKHGVTAARGHLLSHASGAALAVERFDRLPSGERVHTQSVAAMLGINFREPNLDYTELAKLARRLGGPPEVARLYRQLCFNVALNFDLDLEQGHGGTHDCGAARSGHARGRRQEATKTVEDASRIRGVDERLLVAGSVS